MKDPEPLTVDEVGGCLMVVFYLAGFAGTIAWFVWVTATVWRIS